MRVIETLTTEQKISLFQGNVVGIFNSMITDEDLYSNIKYDLCFGYYINRSGYKTVSPIYTRYKALIDSGVQLGDPIEQIIGTYIRSKFLDKWNKIYSSLVAKEYDALNNIDVTETKTGNNSDTTTFDTSVEDTGETGTYEITTRAEENSDDVYGFNSTSAVGDSYSVDRVSEAVIGDKDRNTNHNKQDKTGTESKVFGINESVTKSGRWYGNPTQSIREEIEMRIMFTFMDIMYRDIDSVFTCPLYE